MAKSTVSAAGRVHKMGTGIEFGSVQVHVNGHGLRGCMRGKNAQNAVNSLADEMCATANAMATHDGVYVVHRRLLTVSAHAFIDPDNFGARLDQHYHMTLEKAFWMHYGS